SLIEVQLTRRSPTKESGDSNSSAHPAVNGGLPIKPELAKVFVRRLEHRHISTLQRLAACFRLRGGQFARRDVTFRNPWGSSNTAGSGHSAGFRWPFGLRFG